MTGGTGFLGAHLVGELLGGGHEVRVLARSPSPGLAARGAEVLQGSVTDAQAVAAAVDGVDGVFHLAGVVEHSRREPGRLAEVSGLGTAQVLESASRAGVPRVVYASTSGTVAVSRDPDFVGTDKSPFAEECVREWPYYASKVASEVEGRRQAEQLGIDLVIMRPSLLLGPGDARLSSCRSLLDAIRGKVPFVPPGGLNFVDVRDASAAFSAAMTRGRPGASYLLGGANLPFREYFRRIAELSGCPGPRLRVPRWLGWLPWALAWLASKFGALFGVWDPSLDPVVVEMSQHFWYLDPAAARQDLGFVPRDPDATLRDTIEWLQANHP